MDAGAGEVGARADRRHRVDRRPEVSELPTVRAGGGVINLPRADNPLIFAAPVALSFGLVGPTATQTSRWRSPTRAAARVPGQCRSRPDGSASSVVSVPPTVTVPGPLPVTVTTTKAPDAEATGYIVLTRGAEKRRIPYWFRTGAAKLANAKTTPLRRAGSYSSTTKGGAARVTSYSYPDVPAGARFRDEAARPGARLPPDARPSRDELRRRRHEPRKGRARRAEDRARRRRASPDRLPRAAVQPEPVPPHLRRAGARGRARSCPPRAPTTSSSTAVPQRAPGKFAFRFWINDSTPPAVALRTKRVKLGARLVVAVTDRGSGVDPASLVIQVDGQERNGRLAGGSVRIPTAGLRKGRHTLRLPGLRLPGVAEHGERRSDPPEHAHPADDFRRRCDRRERSRARRRARPSPS